jgi:hypothetical protein
MMIGGLKVNSQVSEKLRHLHVVKKKIQHLRNRYMGRTFDVLENHFIYVQNITMEDDTVLLHVQHDIALGGRFDYFMLDVIHEIIIYFNVKKIDYTSVNHILRCGKR